MPSNVAIANAAPNASSTAVVYAGPGAAPKDSSSTVPDTSIGGVHFSERISWKYDEDNAVMLGATASCEDLWRAIKMVFPPGMTLEDILRALLNRVIELQGDRPSLLTKLKRQLLNEQSVSHKWQREVEDLYKLLNQAMEVIQFFEQSLKNQSSEIDSLQSQSAALSAKIKDLDLLLEQQQGVVENASTANEVLATMAVQASRGNPIMVWPAVKDLLERISFELGSVGDTLRFMSVPSPPSLGAASGWVKEMERFLAQTAAASRQIAGEVSEDALTRSGVLRFVQKRIPNLPLLLAASNSFPRVPLPPYAIPYNTANRCINCAATHAAPPVACSAMSSSQKRSNTNVPQLMYPSEKKKRAFVAIVEHYVRRQYYPSTAFVFGLL
ncbi:hypothetical protein V5O48_011165 [Marasmius crinis-equi]|uniref:Uncharacterized protein n=1 Tax=Marasmius crinis-equi TaxID=585013 RepID=A0ABR3F6B9_9AGAR